MQPGQQDGQTSLLLSYCCPAKGQGRAAGPQMGSVPGDFPAAGEVPQDKKRCHTVNSHPSVLGVSQGPVSQMYPSEKTIEVFQYMKLEDAGVSFFQAMLLFPGSEVLSL